MVGCRNDVEKDFAERGDAMFRDFAERHRPITDTPSYFDGWACFEEQREALARKSAKAPRDPSPPRALAQPEPAPYVPPPKPTPYVPPPRPTSYIAPPKVGRNDPCPCGSGKN
ncbi:MAG: SEC-C metal-binding domain-containing protein [Verrucomicrobiota bacterium]